MTGENFLSKPMDFKLIECQNLDQSESLLTLLSHKEVDRFESDVSIVFVWGDLRGYGDTSQLQEPAKWLSEKLVGGHMNKDIYNQLAGFFVAVIVNKTTGDIQVVNDHIGSVPLFCHRHNEAWFICTSLKLLEHHLGGSPEISKQAIFNYFYYHCIPAPFTIYKDTFKLMPGAVATLAVDGNHQQTTLYNPEFKQSSTDLDALKKRCAEIISDCVKTNVSSDCGAFLSGGLDSSTVAGMLAKHSDNPRTFSIGFEAEGYDETEYALITANHFATEHKVHYLQPEEIEQNFIEVAAFFDEPFGNSSSMAAYVCAKFAKENKVGRLLAGDGGDEIFAGNERYAKQKIFEVYGKLGSYIQAPLKWAFCETPLGGIGPLKKGRSYIEQATTPLPDRLESYNFLNRFELDDMFENGFLSDVDKSIPLAEKQRRYHECTSDNFMDKMLYSDWKFTLADNDLVKVSKMCEMAGVEVKYPLLEKEVVDFSCTVPGDIKLPDTKLRDFYKQSFTGFLAQETLSKPKHGFGLPFGVWMKEQSALKDMTDKYLQNFKSRGIFKISFIEEAIDTYNQGHSGYYGELIWIMLVLEIWLASRES